MSEAAQHSTRELIGALQEAIARQDHALDEIVSFISRLRFELDNDARVLTEGASSLEDTPFDDPFPLVRVASACFDCRSRSEAQGIVAQVARHSNPKEVILALEETLAELRDVEQDRDSDAETALYALYAYVQAYETCLRRLKTAKLDKFYSTAFETLSSMITHFVIEGTLSARIDDPDSAGHVDLDLIEAIFELATSVRCIEGTQQKQAAQVTARALIETVVGLVGPLISSDNANELFLTLYPRYRRITPPDLASSERELVANRIWTCVFPKLFASLDYRADDLLVAIRFSDPLKRIGSFSILSHHLAINPSTPISTFDLDDSPATPSFLLSATLETVRRSLLPHTAYRLAEDDVLFFVWWCVDQQEKLGDLAAAGLGEETLYPLIEVTSSLAALSPNPKTRFLAFRLLATLVLHHCGTSTAAEVTQLALLKDLVTESATPAFRAACIGIVREVLDLKFETNSGSTTSIFLSGALLDELEPALLRHAPRNLFEPGISPEAFLEEHERAVSQKLNFCFFLLTRDRENKTGVRSSSTLERIKVNLIDPLGTYLSRWLDDPRVDAVGGARVDPTISLELELVRTSLRRVEEAFNVATGEA
ncbi:hypothetical protein JCM11491_002691 [Sporobolomyces phaffii]